MISLSSSICINRRSIEESTGTSEGNRQEDWRGICGQRHDHRRDDRPCTSDAAWTEGCPSVRSCDTEGSAESCQCVSLLKKYQCIPFELDPYNANILHLAMADPMDMAAIDDISIVTNLQVEPYIATTREVLTAIDRCYGASETMDAARRFTRERAQLQGSGLKKKTETDVSDAPIVQLVRSLIEQAIRQRASDIHIEALQKKRYVSAIVLMVRFMRRWSMIIVLLPAISTRIKIMGGMDISEKTKASGWPYERLMVDRQEYDIRISSIPTVHGEKLVLRISSKLNLTREKKELGLSDDELQRFDHMMVHPFGIIFVTGPTGSGKSTTLYTALSELNTGKL